MLYVSTKNQTDTYTAYKALNEVTAPDGGIYVPFHLMHFSSEELLAIRKQSCCETIAQILNLFFGARVSGLDVEFAISKTPFKLETLQHKFTVVECWKNPAYSFDYLLKCLYGLISDNKAPGCMPAGWAYVGIKVALLFGLYTQMGNAMQGMDIAITEGDYSDLATIAYAKSMGLPLAMIICTCDNNSNFWDLVNRGEYKATANAPDYMEAFLYITFGTNTYSAPEITDEEDSFEQKTLADYVYASVVSSDRIESVIANMYRTNGYTFDTEAALAYGGLQDYRSSTGVSKETLILSKKRPSRIRE